MKVSWSELALGDIKAIYNYLTEQKNGDASIAYEVAQDLVSRANRLADFPRSGRLGRLQGTRELVVTPYIIVYRLVGSFQAVSIEAVIHGARRF